MLRLLLSQLGADGGTIPTRDELVKLKPKAEKASAQALARIKYFSCALSKAALEEPIVADCLGNLYNKEAVVRALLEKQVPDELRHLHSLKDVFTVHFHANPEFERRREQRSSDAGSVSPWICPVSLVEVGLMPFSVMRPCGCVLAERALREVARDDACIACGTALAPGDVVALCRAADEYAAAREELLQRLELERRAKADAKAQRRAAKAEAKAQAAGQQEADAGTAQTPSANAAASTADSSERKPADDGKVAKRRAPSSSSTAPVAKKARGTSDAAFSTESSVYQSLFNDGKEVRETFACRSVSGRYV